MSIRICKKKFVQIVNCLDISTRVESDSVIPTLADNKNSIPNEPAIGQTNYRATQRRWDALKHDLVKLRASTTVDPIEKKHFMHEVARCLPIIDLRISIAQRAQDAALHLAHGTKHLNSLQVAMEAIRPDPAQLAYDRLKEDRSLLTKVYPFAQGSYGETLDTRLKELTLDIRLFIVASDAAIRRYDTTFPAEAEAHRQQRRQASIDKAAPVRQLVKESKQLSKDLLGNTRSAD